MVYKAIQGSGSGPPGPPGPEGPAGPGFTDGTAIGQLKQWDGAAWINVAAPSANGQIIRWNGTVWVAVDAPVQPFTSLVGFGTTGVMSASSTTFLFPWSGPANTGTAQDTNGCIVVPFAGVVDFLTVRNATPTGTADVVYTLIVNGAATALTVTHSSGSASFGQDVVNSVVVPAGARLNLRAQNPDAGTLTNRPNVTMRYEGTPP